MNKIKETNSEGRLKVFLLMGDSEGADKDRVTEMAREDSASFEAIEM